MQPNSYKRHRFPPDIIQQGFSLYYRFTLSLREPDTQHHHQRITLGEE